MGIIPNVKHENAYASACLGEMLLILEKHQSDFGRWRPVVRSRYVKARDRFKRAVCGT